MIIYNMNDKSVQSINKLLTIYEQKIFNLFLEFFNNIKIQNINKFVGFIKSLYFLNDKLEIIKYEADSRYIEEEIKYFKDHNIEKEKKKIRNFKRCFKF